MKNDSRILILENNMMHLADTLLEIKNEMKEMRADMKEIRQELKRTNEAFTRGFENINARMWSNFLWMVGIGIGLYGSLFGILAHAFKWF